MHKIVRRLAVTSVALAATVAGLAGPAQAGARTAAPSAARGIDDCLRGDACLWSDRNFTGDRWQWPDRSSVLPDWIDRKASSLRNNGRHCQMVVWDEQGYTGHSWGIPLGTYRAYLNSNPGPSPVGSWEDWIRSVSWNNCQ